MGPQLGALFGKVMEPLKGKASPYFQFTPSASCVRCLELEAKTCPFPHTLFVLMFHHSTRRVTDTVRLACLGKPSATEDSPKDTPFLSLPDDSSKVSGAQSTNHIPLHTPWCFLCALAPCCYIHRLHIFPLFPCGLACQRGCQLCCQSHAGQLSPPRVN